MMRIITGSAKGVRLLSPDGNETRPTSERVKEAIFSALQLELQGRRVLDLFAGTGQMGLEAMSRGAASVTFADASADAMAIVKKNAENTGFFAKARFLIGDYRNVIRKAAGRDTYDLFFIDPPYALGAAGDSLARILRAGIAAPGALFVTESDTADIFVGNDALFEKFLFLKSARYSVSFIHILRLREEESADEGTDLRQL